ncbi:LysR family transcriptional regulator [Ferrimonas pelagia]|uniref:LysR family transcriptional regulator n=1 Tax=Ferrimonas pelagia TaxID=1177826 RepID=A0ABP9EYH2_9GAMM
MKALQDLKIFLHTAQHGSLSAAARQLGISPAVASAALKRLETELGTPLLIRSTRQLRLTQQGEAFLQHAQQAVALLEQGMRGLQGEQAQFRGVLQLSASSGLGRHQLQPVLAALHRTHPQMTLKLQISDRLADLYAQPVDVALRYGDPEDSDLIAQAVNRHNRRVLCAAPSYVDEYGEPDSLDALKQHRCLSYMLANSHYDRWRIEEGGKRHSIKINTVRYADDGDVVRQWACEGAGIAYKSELEIADDVQAGRLVTLSPERWGEPAPLYLISPGRHQLTPIVRELHQRLLAALA